MNSRDQAARARFCFEHAIAHARLLDQFGVVQRVKRTRKRRKPDSIKLVKRAMAAGLIVKSASATADSVVLTFGEAEAPADGAVIETADELRKLI